MFSSIASSTIRAKLAPGIKAILLSPWFHLALAAELWGFSLQTFNLSAMKDWGLLSIFPVSIILAYLLVIIGFANLYRQSTVSDAIFASYILLFVLMIHGTPYFLFGTVRYAWSWKHIGIIDYITRHGAVDPTISDLSVYHNWPGFFALNALFTQLAGFPGAQVYAGWAPAFFEMLFAFGLLALFRLFTPDRRLQWLGVWIFILTNWIAQDYFAPQAITYFMTIGVQILVLLGFGPKRALTLDSWKKRLSKIGPVFRPLSRLLEHITNLKLPPMLFEPTRSRAAQLALGVIVLLVFGVIVSIHQLTPFMGVVAISFLVVFGVVSRWRTLPFWMVLLIVLWLAFPAQAYNSQVVGSTLESFGKIDQTVDKGLVNVAKISSGQAIVSWMGRGLSGLIILLAGLGAFQRIRKGYFDLPAILLAAAPIIILFLNSYGGEALFRVYFFMLPGLSFLAAGAIVTKEELWRGWLQPIAIGGLSLIMLIAFLFAYYGKEHQYSFTKAEEEAAEYVYSHAIPNSLLVEGSRNYPSQFINYEYFTYVAIDREPPESQNHLLANPADVLYVWLSNSSRYTTSYLLITRSQKIYVDEIGSMPSGSLDKIQTALENSDKFKIVFSNQDAVVFTIRESIKLK
jgi:hypothetical protein